MSYIKRIIEADLVENLSASGAVLIKGPKSCGKTVASVCHSKKTGLSVRGIEWKLNKMKEKSE